MKLAISIVAVGWLGLIAACSTPAATPQAGGAGPGRVGPPPPGSFARVERPTEGKGSAGTHSRAADSGGPEGVRLPPTGTSGFGGTYQPATGNFGFGGTARPQPQTGASGIPEDSED